MSEIQVTYTKRAKGFERQAQALRTRYNRLALLRLAIFIIALGVIVLLWTVHFVLALAFLFVFIGVFYRFIRWHQAIQDRARFLEDLSTINEEELSFLALEIDAFDEGEDFLNPEHPYALDLDIFGPYSFFQYTNRTSTSLGRERLADLLQKQVNIETIRARQEVIAELSKKLDWRQELQAWGRETKDEPKHIQLLQQWLNDAPFVSGRRWLIAAMYGMPLFVLSGLALWGVYDLPWFLGILFLLPSAWILRNTLNQVNHTHGRTTHAEQTLGRYARLIKHIESENFESKILQDLHKEFVENGQQASQRIHRLSYIISQLNVRYNAFAIILNIISLWDLHWVYGLEKWKVANRERLLHWFAALQEMEALCSLATTYYNNPDWVFPEFHKEHFFEAADLGHPLIPSDKRICNDLKMPTDGHIKLITGSNMAGKSTFLRTVGLNIVLANIGAPVCASALRLPGLQVYTSMRTQDALHESTSSFYAELKRLRVIIEAVEVRHEEVFFLLDEILKGTNSRDRHTGAKALIRQLIQSKGSGLIATHDLELGAMEATAEGAIENLCMEVEIENNELFFDYKLKKGVSKSFNATLLMKNMGIKIDALR